MAGNLAPLDLGYVVAINLAHPAFVEGDVAWTVAGRIFAGAIHVDDRVLEHRPGMAENRRARKWRRLSPDVLLNVKHLHVTDGVTSKPTTDQIDVPLAISSNRGIVHGHWNVRSAVPAPANRFVHGDVGHRHFPALGIHHIANKDENLL